jgi:hypothetical protein
MSEIDFVTKLLKLNFQKILQNYKQQKAITQKVIAETAKNHWQDFCSKLKENHPLKPIWRMVRRMKGNNTRPEINPIITESGEKITTNFEKANIFAKTFSQISSDTNYTPDFLNQKQKNFTRRNPTPSYYQNSQQIPRTK